jgi:hypothetical protein
LPDLRNIKIMEPYRDYTPPVDVARIVRQLLDTVPEKYLGGLDSVVLTNEASLSRRDRVGRVWSRKRKFDKSRVLGRYHGRTRNGSAYIELRVDRIFRWIEGVPVAFLFRNILVGHVLFHELGHHIHRTIRPEYKEKEGVADNWAGRLNVNFVRKKYWYALPLITPVVKTYGFMRRKQWI